MGTAITVIIIILVIVVILALIGMGSYNGFVKSRNLIQESWRQIDVELNRRYELIPNLVETVRAYAAHERNTLEDVTRLRSQAQQLSQSEGSLPSQERADVEAALSGAVRNSDRQRRGLSRSEEQPELPGAATAASRDRGSDRRWPSLLQRQRPGLQHQGRVGADQHHRQHVQVREGHLLPGR